MKNAMILLAILLSASTAVANVDDDTIKVTRVMLGGNVSKVSVEGYANVSIVADTVSYLTTEERFLSSGSDKRFTYSLNSQNGLTISADPGAKNLVLHLVQQGSLDLRTEDWASVSLNPIGNLQSLIINTSDYSSVSIMPNNREDTLKVDNINLHAEDFSKIALWPRCIGNTLSMNAEDHSMIQVSSFRGANIFKQVSDFAQLNLDSYDGTLYASEEESHFASERLDKKHLSKTVGKNRRANKPGFHLSFAWAFNNWGDSPLSGLNGMDDPYAIGTTFSSYQLAAMYNPLNVEHWAIGIGVGYESDIYRFSGNSYMSLGTTDDPAVSTFYNRNLGNAQWSSRLVARYITMPIAVMYKPTRKFGIVLTAIPGLNYTSSNTGLKHKGKSFADNAKMTDVEDVSRVMNPYKVDARLTLVFTNIGVFLQAPTMPVFKNMDRDVYPIKFGFILGM